MSEAKAVSIFFELGELEGALDAAQSLAIDLQGEPWPGNSDGLRKLYIIGSVLALLGCRIRLLRQGIDGAVDPVLLLARHNEVPARERGAVGDLKLLSRRAPGRSGR